MFFLLILWAYDRGIDNSYYHFANDNSNKILEEDYDDFSFTSSGSKEKTYPTTTKNYAKGKIPSILHHRLSELFSISNIRHILNTPDILEDLRKWQVSNLSAHDIYEQKDHAIHSAIENLCSLLGTHDPYFCDNNRTLLERIVTNTFHDIKSVVLGQLLQLIQSTIKEEETKLRTLQKNAITIKQQAPARRRKMLAERAHAREEKRKLDKNINDLDKQIKEKTYSDENYKRYDEETLADLKEQKNLLLIEPEHIHHDLNKQEQALEKITKQKHRIQSDIEKFKTILKGLSDIMKKRENSADLEDAWNEVNAYFEKFEKDKQEDIRRKEEKSRQEKETIAKKNAEDQNAQAQEIQFMQALGGKSSDPEAAKESANWLSSIGKLFNSVGG